MIDFTKLEEHTPDTLDKVMAIITLALCENNKFELQEDGTCWCSDSNQTIDVQELAAQIISVI